MKHHSTISPDAMLIFLKQAALEDHWTVAYLGKALGLDLSTANQVAAEMALAGYIEPVRAKKDTWRNTDVGNTLAGIRSRRLTRAKAEDLLTDLEDRAAQIAMKDSSILKVAASEACLLSMIRSRISILAYSWNQPRKADPFATPTNSNC